MKASELELKHTHFASNPFQGFTGKEELFPNPTVLSMYRDALYMCADYISKLQNKPME